MNMRNILLITVTSIATSLFLHCTAFAQFTDTGVSLPYGGEVAWGDFDNDGDLDLAIANSRTTKIYRNDANTLVDVGIALPYGYYIGWADYDNDNMLDLAITEGCVTKICQNKNNGIFQEKASLFGCLDSNFAWGDYNNDGKLDLLITGNSYTCIYKNKGNSTFDTTNDNLLAINRSFVTSGDYDNDGNLDFMITGLGADGRWINRICHNNEFSINGNEGINITGITGHMAAWGDYDNDSDLDVAIASSGKIALYRNDHAQSFVDIAINTAGIKNGCIAWGDYDNDGNLDLVVSGSNGSLMTKIYHNDNPIHNTPPTAPTNLKSNITCNGITFTWDASTDAQTPSPGLSYNLRVGTKPGSGDICNGMANSDGFRKIPALGNAQKRLSWTLINIPTGNIYWSVQAIDTSYAGSAWAAEHMLITTQASSAKSLPNGSSVIIKGIVSAVFANCCYVQTEDRSSGIRVETTAAVKEGDKVYVSGKINKKFSGERYIENATITPSDS